jgi:hypothetical protein
MTVFNPFDRDSMPEPPTLDGDQEEVPVNNSRNAGKNSAAEQGLEIPMGWKPTVAEPVPVMRCTGTSSTTGERCRKWSLRGTTVCKNHGAQFPSVQEHANAVVESARMRLFGMADDAVEVMYDLIQEGKSDQIRLKAAENILNRSGIKDAIDINVEVSHNENPSDSILKQLQIMRERQEAAKKEAEEELEDQGEIIDAEEE